ncbi:PAS domain S-box protein [Natronorubrum halophilum]|uniref:PAS domain S-box protein n=1 Tax=Natronorubrum halophilum TaxID=1702106 RepID=UPI000EF74E47|nr:PAS domain S-box protein [Natronorubrum halophilum]
MDSTSEADTELRARVRQQEAVAELGQRALETDDLEEVLRDASVAVAETLDTEYATVLESYPGDDLRLRHGVGWRDGLVESATIPSGIDSLAGYTLRSEGAITVDDLRADERFSGTEVLASHDVVSGISVVIGSVGDPWGVLETHTTERRAFTEHDVSFVQRVADVLESAIENRRTRRELEESYGRITHASYALDDDWTFTRVDDRTESLIDFEGGGLLGKNVWEEFEWAADSKLRDEYERAMATQVSTTFEFYYPDPLDSWYEVHAAPTESELSVYFRDITDRKNREQQLEQYHALTEAASDVIVTIDEASTIQSVNPVVEDVFGYQPGELEGESLTTLMPDGFGERHRAGLTEYLETDDRTLDWDYVELTGRHADGSDVPLAVSFSEIEYENERYFTGIVRDITERTERERELELFRTLLDRSTDSVLVIDPETGRYLDVNETACRRRGYSRAEFLQRSVPDLQTEIPDREAWRSFVADLKDDGQTTFDGEHRRKDGTTYPIEINATYVELDRAYVLSVARDVTERRERERELEERERQLSALMANVPGMVYRCRNDRGWPMEFVSDACRDVTGYEPDALERGDVGWGEDIMLEEDRERLWEAVHRAVAEGETFSETYRIETADGEVRWVSDYGRGIFDEGGELVDVEGIISDITDRKEIQRQLEESERRYRTLAENFPNGAVGVYDRDLRYTLTRGNVLGERLPSADRLEGEQVSNVFPPQTVDDLESLFRATVEAGETGSVTVEFDGRSWRVWTAPLRDADGDIFAGLSFTQDVTEQVERKEKLEAVIEELEESNERLEQFAYAASHDLQEPLRMVSSYLQLIESRYAEELDEDAAEFLAFAVDGAERMREMIDGLLEYSRVDTQGDPLEPIELEGVLENALDNLQVKIEERNADIATDSLPRVRGDESQLAQVFQNLLSNAIEYSGDGPPRIYVGAERNGWKWTVSVRDDGIGIDPDDEERVFEVFQRLHSREEHPGTGIGLALCQRIVERHGGEIWVDAEPGEGSTFSFTLQAARAER